MAQLRAILNRKKAAQNIGKMTRAMAMIAGAKLQKLRTRTLAAQPYAQRLREMVAVLAATIGDVQHPLFRRSAVEEPAKRIALFVITSNRGLVGAYNSDVLRMASNFIRQRETEGNAVEVHVAGKKGISYFTAHGRPLAQRHDQPGDVPDLVNVEKITDFLADRFLSGQIDSVHVVYTNFVSAGVHRPELLTLLPAAALVNAAARVDGRPRTLLGNTTGAVAYDVSPEPSTLMGALLPLALKTCLFECFLNAATSEQAARKMVMLRATENTHQMFKSLTLRYNRARQDHITNELMIIISAAEALKASAKTR